MEVDAQRSVKDSIFGRFTSLPPQLVVPWWNEPYPSVVVLTALVAVDAENRVDSW